MMLLFILFAICLFTCVVTIGIDAITSRLDTLIELIREGKAR